MSSSPAKIKKAMRVIWEGEGHSWDELYEYPYSERESDKIVARLKKTATELSKLFTEEVK
jgi:hypothetical protein